MPGRDGGRAGGRWARLLLGIALVAAVVVVASRLSELEEFVRLAERAQPIWLAVAAVLQVATYPAQGGIWRLMVGAAGSSLSTWAAAKLTLAKLFVDQSLPTAGISGTLLVGQALERRGIAPPTASSAIVVYTASNQLAFVVSLAIGLVLAALRGESMRAVAVGSMLALGLGALLAGGALLLSGRQGGRVRRALTRVPLLHPVLNALATADPRLVHRPGLLLKASGYQLLTLALDAATLWTLLRAVGEAAPPAAAFISLALSNVFRLVGVLPGGLGAFEAASVLTLKLAGIPLAAGLSATLLFRLLSFWLPMLPGWWVARAALGSPRHAGLQR